MTATIRTDSPIRCGAAVWRLRLPIVTTNRHGKGAMAGRDTEQPVPAGGGATMWKSFCLAAGIFAFVLGVEMLIVDSAVVMPLLGDGQPRQVTAPEWVPWTLISVGAMTILQFVSLPGRGGSSTPQANGRW